MIISCKINIPEERLAAITSKLVAYDWSQVPDAGGWSANAGISDLKQLVNYWINEYDWRKTEQRINEYSHFITDIERSETVHFIHLKGDGSKPPVLLLRLADLRKFIASLTTTGR